MDLPAPRPGRGRVRFDGVDHEATVFLDGDEVAHHVGAFTPFEVDVPDGRAPARGRRAPGAGERAAGGQDEPRPRAQEPHGLRLGLLPAARAPGHLAPGDDRPAAGGVPARALEDGVGMVEVDGETVLRVESPELWWPNGMGRQRLYRAGDCDVGFRTVELDDEYRLVVNGSPCRSKAGTGSRSTRSTACRGRTSSRTCCDSRRARAATCCACGAAA